MPESINIQVSGPNPRKNNGRTLLFNQAVKIIKQRKLAPKVEQVLLKELEKQPSDTYQNFIDNLHVYIAKTKNDGKTKG